MRPDLQHEVKASSDCISHESSFHYVSPAPDPVEGKLLTRLVPTNSEANRNLHEGSSNLAAFLLAHHIYEAANAEGATSNQTVDIPVAKISCVMPRKRECRLSCRVLAWQRNSEAHPN